MARSPYLSLWMRVMEIHAPDDNDLCIKCRDQIPCDTMRAVWIFDLETRPPGGAF